MHGLQVNRDFIEKQPGRTNLLQPIILIVRNISPNVKGIFVNLHKNMDEFVLPMLPPGGSIDDIIVSKEE